MLIAKKWALKYAVNAACTILTVRNTVKQYLVAWIAIVNACHFTQVDQIIMAKQAGGPKGGGPGGDED